MTKVAVQFKVGKTIDGKFEDSFELNMSRVPMEDEEIVRREEIPVGTHTVRRTGNDLLYKVNKVRHTPNNSPEYEAIVFLDLKGRYPQGENIGDEANYSYSD